MTGIACNFVANHFLFDTLFQVEGTVGHHWKSDVPLPSTSKQGSANSGEHLRDCRSENELHEPDVIINATLPPDDITKHVHQLLDYVRGKSADIIKGESVVTMDVWDFAGQHLYYASHPLFLSSRAIYVLVHNLSKQLFAPAEPCVRQGTLEKKMENPNNETNLENLLSWLATIHSVTKEKEEMDHGAQRRLPYLRPPVLIVGTHADKPAEDMAVMKFQIQKKISNKEYGKHVVRPLFSIDNTSSLTGPKRGTPQPGIKFTNVWLM